MKRFSHSFVVSSPHIQSLEAAGRFNNALLNQSVIDKSTDKKAFLESDDACFEANSTSYLDPNNEQTFSPAIDRAFTAQNLQQLCCFIPCGKLFLAYSMFSTPTCDSERE